MTNKNPQIEWTKISGKQCLKFIFGEKLTAQEAEVAIAEWRKAFQSRMDGAIILIWDCRKMTDYDNDARAQWIEAIKEMKSQIDTIWLISTSGFIRTGASIMSFFVNMQIKPVSCESEIEV
jgi:phosphopantetheine adenylyltransferase